MILSKTHLPQAQLPTLQEQEVAIDGLTGPITFHVESSRRWRCSISKELRTEKNAAENLVEYLISFSFSLIQRLRSGFF